MNKTAYDTHTQALQGRAHKHLPIIISTLHTRARAVKIRARHSWAGEGMLDFIFYPASMSYDTARERGLALFCYPADIARARMLTHEDGTPAMITIDGTDRTGSTHTITLKLD